jgi:aspartate/methionine/tyrosine aminotransferase
MLISNPINPVGIVYSADQLLLAVSWCRKKRLHLIMDEIYALSNYEPSQPFESISRLLNNDLGDDIHIIWSLSKDFGMSGLRLGVLYSQNEKFLQASAILNDFYQVSNVVQYAASKLLSDKQFLLSYIPENLSRIKR